MAVLKRVAGQEALDEFVVSGLPIAGGLLLPLSQCRPLFRGGRSRSQQLDTALHRPSQAIPSEAPAAGEEHAHDCIVVGAGPAGSVAALQRRRTRWQTES